MAKPIKIDIVGDSKGFSKAIGTVSQDMNRLSTKARDAGKKIAVGLGVGVAGIAALGTKAALVAVDFEKSMAEVFTLLPGISGDAMDEMNEQVLGFSKEFAVLPEEVVPALYDALSAGVPTDSVFDYMETATMLATGGVTDLNTAVDGLSSIVNAYGADVIDASTASDIMFTTVKFGKTTVDQLAAGISNVTPVASALGVSFEEVGASLAVLTATGVKTKVATTQIRSALAELATEGSKADKAFQKIAGQGFSDFIAEGGTMTEGLMLMADSAERTGGSVINMFGSIEAGSGVLALTKNDGAALIDVMGEMENSAGATEEAYAMMTGTVSFQMDSIKSAVNVLMIQIGNKLIPVIAKVADYFLTTLLPALETLSAWIETNILPSIAKFIGWIKDSLIPTLKTLVEDYLKPLGQTVLKKVSEAFNFLTEDGENMTPLLAGLATLVGGLAIAFGILKIKAAFALAVVLAPIALIIAKIALVAVAVYLVVRAFTRWYENVEWFRKAVDWVVNWFVNSAVPALKKVPGQIKGAWLRFLEWFKTNVGPIIAAVAGFISEKWEELVEWFKTYAMPKLEQVGEDIKIVFRAVWKVIKFVAGLIVTSLLLVVDVVKAAWSRWGEAIIETVGNMLNGVLQIAEGFFDFFVGVWRVAAALVQGKWGELWEGIKDVFNANLKIVTGALDIFWEYIKLVFKIGLDIILLAVNTFWDLVKSAFSEAFGIVYTAVETTWGLIETAFTTSLDFIQTSWEIVWNAISTFVSDIWDDISGFVSEGFDGIVAFVVGLPDRIASAVTGAFDSIWEEFKKILEKVKGAAGPLSGVVGAAFDLTSGALGAIPFLAKGGVIDQPTLAMVGEGNDREIVSPDRLLRQIVREESGGVGGQPTVINQTFNGFSTDEALALAKQGTSEALREVAMRRRK